MYVPATLIAHCSKLLPVKAEKNLTLNGASMEAPEKNPPIQCDLDRKEEMEEQTHQGLTFAAHVNLFLIKIYTQDDLNHLPLHKQIICTQVIVQQKKK